MIKLKYCVYISLNFDPFLHSIKVNLNHKKIWFVCWIQCFFGSTNVYLVLYNINVNTATARSILKCSRYLIQYNNLSLSRLT